MDRHITHEELVMDFETFLATTWWIFVLALFLGMLIGLSYHFHLRELAICLAVLAVLCAVLIGVFVVDGAVVLSVTSIIIVFGFCVGHGYGIVRFPR